MCVCVWLVVCFLVCVCGEDDALSRLWSKCFRWMFCGFHMVVFVCFAVPCFLNVFGFIRDGVFCSI